MVSFSIDETATIVFKAVNASTGAPFPNASMDLVGTRTIGTTSSDDDVYLVDEAITVTGTFAEYTKSDVPWDNYTVTLPTSSVFDFAGSWPISPFSVLPATNTTFTVSLIPNSAHTLLTVVTDELDRPISSGSVEISADFETFVATGALGELNPGQAFFNELNTGQFSYIVNSPYQEEATGSIFVVDDKVENVQMTASGSAE